MDIIFLDFTLEIEIQEVLWKKVKWKVDGALDYHANTFRSPQK